MTPMTASTVVCLLVFLGISVPAYGYLFVSSLHDAKLRYEEELPYAGQLLLSLLTFCMIEAALLLFIEILLYFRSIH